MVNLLLCLRLKHWVKNLFVFLPLVFSKKLCTFPENLWTLAAFFLFCLAAGVVYLVNDVIDRERDKVHPVKRDRHITSGKVSPSQAIVTASILGILSVILSFFLNVYFGWVIVFYIAANIIYAKILKDLVIIDVLCIAVFFLLRVLAGSIVAGVSLSHWIIFMTFLLALFLGLNKRRQELDLFGEDAVFHRSVLSKYNTRFIDRMISVITPSILVIYMLYTTDVRTVSKLGTNHLIYTIPFVFYGVFRYLYLIHVQGRDGDPTGILFSDRKMQVNLVLWILVCISVIYF